MSRNDVPESDAEEPGDRLARLAGEYVRAHDDQNWHVLDIPDRMTLPDQRYATLAVGAMGAPMPQMILAVCADDGEERLLSMPVEAYHRRTFTAADFQVHTRADIQSYYRWQNSIDRMNRRPGDTTVDFHLRIMGLLGVDLDEPIRY